jgi:UDP-N-acetylmuramoyl-L-alanyl-D-glutamate--2,6-diaminopimelate ligase
VTLGSLIAAARSLASDSNHRVEAIGHAAQVVSSVTHDSRAASRGAVFVAIPGHRTDGLRFAGDALSRGAVAVVSEAPRPPEIPETVCWLETAHARISLAELASIFYGHPSDRLLVAGVTGTNGKTTTAYLLASVLTAAGLPSGRLGTVTFRIGPKAADESDASHTTPEASEVQRLLGAMVDRGCKACAMEVSSHALALHRADGVRFSLAIFTNLTRDHLDFHGDMQRYFAAKRRLFEMLPAGAPAVVNVDDPKGTELASWLPVVLTYGIDQPAAVRATGIQASLEGLAFEVHTPRGTLAIRSPLIGRPNVYNILAVVAAGVALDLPDTAIEQGVARLEHVPGRFQLVSSGADDVRVVVDYAHTDDALKNLLETARALATGRVVSVFGCGGDRDRSKRPLMGAVAARLSDLVILTSDNPRTEDPARIVAEIKLGLSPTPEPGAPSRPGTAFLEILDRRKAIEQAIRTAQPGDLVLVAGKGHERYQVIGGRTLPFDDVEVARAALGQRRAGSRV